MDFKSYCFGLQAIVRGQRAATFKLGDWLCDGEEFGDRVYAAAARATGLPVSALRRIASVSKRVPKKVRNKKLSWVHHRLVQSFPPDRQRTLLQEAEPLLGEASALSANRFKEKIERRYPGTFKSKRTGPYRRFCFEIPEAQFLSLEKLAEAKRMTLTDYIAQVVAQHASSPFAQAALHDAKATRDMRSSKNRKKGRERWEAETIRSVEAIVEELNACVSRNDSLEPSDVVRAWRRRNGGRPFPLSLAQKRTTFGDQFGDLTAEDLQCGKFEPVDEDLQFFEEDDVA